MISARRLAASSPSRTFSLEVHPGEIVALVGDNGAGKSTLIKIISGVYLPTSGSIAIEARNRRLSSPATTARAHGIEVVYQDLALAEQQTVYMNMFLGREPTNAVRPSRPAPHDRARRKSW
jgi:ABC-type sugar transport system ATPase subunit